MLRSGHLVKQPGGDPIISCNTVQDILARISLNISHFQPFESHLVHVQIGVDTILLQSLNNGLQYPYIGLIDLESGVL